MRSKFVLSCAAVAIFLGACSPGSPEPASRPASGGTITVGLPEVGSLDPAKATGQSSFALLKAACDSVTALDPDSGKPEPALAQSWSFAPGAQKLSIELKKGSVFADGTPVNSQSVRESLSRVARPATASPWATLVDKIAGFPEVQSDAATHLSGVKALTSETLEIELSEPFSDLPTVLAHPALTPLSLKSVSAPSAGPEFPVCSGPYQITRGEDEKGLRLLRQKSDGDDRRGGAPGKGARMADLISVKGFETQAEAYAAFKSGDVGLAPVPQTDIMEAQDGRGFERRAGAQTSLLVFDATRSPTNDPKLRQAISLAIDRLVIIDASFPDQRPPALRYLPESFIRDPGPACEELIRKLADPAKAKERLEAAASEVGQPIPLTFDPAEFGRLVAQAIQVQVKEVLGIDLEPNPVDAAEFEASLKTRSPSGMWLMNTRVDLPIPEELIGALFLSGSPKNASGFSDPEVDGVIQNARKATTPPEAARLWAEAENKICEAMPAVPMWRASGQWIRDPNRVVVTGDSMLDLSGSPIFRRISAGGASPQPQ